MSTEYIPREAAMECVEDLVDTMSVCTSIDECLGMKSMKSRALSALSDIPAADVVAVRHSHWVYDGYGEFHCHACKTIWHITEGTIDDLAFCPNCGADMRET